MYVVENRFDYEGELHHMVEFYYKIEILGTPPLYTIDENSFECEWIVLEYLHNYDIRPKFLKDEIIKWNGNVCHIDIFLEK